MENREIIENLEAQGEELLALQSIYDETILVIDQDVEPPSGRFLIRPKLPHPFHLICNITQKCVGDEQEHVSESKVVLVEYLPPLTLYFELPNTYPTQTGPAFMLVCKWLTLEQLSCLCEKLDTLWEESGKDVILFSWMQFLQEETLLFLDIHNSLDISSLILYKRYERMHRSIKENLKEAGSRGSITCRKTQYDKQYCVVDKNDKLFEVRDNLNKLQNKEVNFYKNSRYSKYPKDSFVAHTSTPLQDTTYNNERSPRTFYKSKNKGFSKKCGIKEFSIKNTQKELQDSNQTVSQEVQYSETVCASLTDKEKINSDRSDVAVNQEEIKPQKIKDNFISHSCKEIDKFSSGEISMFKPCVHRGKGRYDQRAVLDLHTGSTLLQSLIEYNKLQKQEAFNNEWFTCKVCFTQKQGSQFISFHGCNHLFCQECMSSYFEIRIRDGSSHSLGCPEEKCTSQALPSQIKELVSEDLYAQYDASLLATTLDSMSDIHYCPRSHCQCATIVEPNSKMALCPSCGFVFCVYCKMVYHGVEPCRFKPEERKQIRDEYLRANKEEKSKMEQRYGSRVLQILVDETLSEEWLASNSKKCPHCNALIEKIDGCNKMTCWRCGAYFCWLCMQRLPQTNPYHHFNNMESDCFNRLFYGVLEMNEDDFL